MIKPHDKRCRRDGSRIVRYFESRTSYRAKRQVTYARSRVVLGVSMPHWALEAPPQPHQRRRPARGRSRVSTRQVSCTLEVLYPARRAPHHPAGASHLDDQLVELVLHDPHPPVYA